MAGKRVKTKKNSGSFGLSLFIVAIIAVVTGYFLGNYYIKMALAPNAESSLPASRPVVQQTKPPIKEQTAPVVVEPSVPATNQNNLVVAIEDERFSTGNSYLQDNIPSSSDGLIRVQVGAFQTRPQAMETAKKLQAAGYPTYITTEKPYRIQVGAFKDQKAAKALVDRLVAGGYTDVILK